MNKILTIIPTLNSSKTLAKHLEQLQHQSHKIDILLIDSSSEDDTVKIAKSKKINFLEINRSDFNHATTRNIALQHEADFYFFLTQDALAVDNYLVAKLLKPFDDKEVVVSYAKQTPNENTDLIEKFARETNYPATSVVKSKELLPKLGIKTFFCSNSCAMYRASYFKKVGGFKDGLIMNEDMEFAARAILDNKKIAYQADAKVLHSHDNTLGDVFKRYFDIGVFFKTNEWIVDEVNKHASTESTGIKQAQKELAYLLKKSPLFLPKSILFSFTKYIAYKLGNQYDKMPFDLRVFFSLHKNWHYITKEVK